jgi:hypothetical protein
MYADDSNAWAIGSSLDVVRAKLKEIAAQFVCWARVNGLAVNALKTQLLVSSNSGKCNDFNITVDGKVIAVANEFNLLGVTYNRRFATTPHDESVSRGSKTACIANRSLEPLFAEGAVPQAACRRSCLGQDQPRPPRGGRAQADCSRRGGKQLLQGGAKSRQ